MFARRANLPHPDGHCLNPQIRAIILSVPHSQEGRFAIVTNVGRGMRWTRYVTRRMTYRGRRNRVVLAPRRWRQVGDDASHHADDGGKKARSPRRPRISRKTIAQGMLWYKNINKINSTGGLCPPSCRDPLRLGFFNNLSVEACPTCAARPLETHWRDGTEKAVD